MKFVYRSKYNLKCFWIRSYTKQENFIHSYDSHKLNRIHDLICVFHKVPTYYIMEQNDLRNIRNTNEGRFLSRYWSFINRLIALFPILRFPRERGCAQTKTDHVPPQPSKSSFLSTRRMRILREVTTILRCVYICSPISTSIARFANHRTKYMKHCWPDVRVVWICAWLLILL